MSEDELAALVTRDAMIGTAKVSLPGGRAVNGVHDMGGMHGMGPVAPEADEPVFHERWEGRVFALNRALGALGKMEHRCGPAFSRAHSAGRLFAHELLREMVDRCS